MHNRRQPKNKMKHREFRSNDQGKSHKGKSQLDSSSIRNHLFNRDTKYNEKSREWVSSSKFEQAVGWRSLVATTDAHAESIFPSIESTLKHWSTESTFAH